MRTTLSIDDDVLAAAEALAAKERRSVGDVLSSLARQALHPPDPNSLTCNGVPLLPVRSGITPVTPALVNQLRDELQ
jgi:hypothetical protein